MTYRLSPTSSFLGRVSAVACARRPRGHGVVCSATHAASDAPRATSRAGRTSPWSAASAIATTTIRSVPRTPGSLTQPHVHREPTVHASTTPASLRGGATTCDIEHDASTYRVPTVGIAPGADHAARGGRLLHEADHRTRDYTAGRAEDARRQSDRAPPAVERGRVVELWGRRWPRASCHTRLRAGRRSGAERALPELLERKDDGQRGPHAGTWPTRQSQESAPSTLPVRLPTITIVLLTRRSPWSAALVGEVRGSRRLHERVGARGAREARRRAQREPLARAARLGDVLG